MGWPTEVYNYDPFNTTFQRPTPPIHYAGVYAFAILNLVAGAGLLIVVTTALLSTRVKRLPTWYNFCFSWILSCVFYTLLFLAGQQEEERPTWSLCFAQSALLYAIPPTTAGTTLAFFLQILLCLPKERGERQTKIAPAILCSLLIGPYIAFVILLVGVLVYTAQNPNTLQKAPRGTYCNSTSSVWQKISFAIVAVMSVLIVITQAQLAFRLHTKPSLLCRNSRTFAIALRSFSFSLIGAIMVIIAMVFIISDNHTLTLDILLSTLPILALLVFGTQRDLFQTWFCWDFRLYVPSFASSKDGNSLFTQQTSTVSSSV